VACGVYAIARIGGNKHEAYVGQSVNVEGRCARHLDDLKRGRHENINLQRAWTESGGQLEARILEVVEPCTDTKARLLQREMVHMNRRYPTYNVALSPLGDGLDDQQVEWARQSRKNPKPTRPSRVGRKTGVKGLIERLLDKAHNQPRLAGARGYGK
jgi:hypothetical protein